MYTTQFPSVIVEHLLQTPKLFKRTETNVGYLSLFLIFHTHVYSEIIVQVTSKFDGKK
jgi:hypothetical protein